MKNITLLVEYEQVLLGNKSEYHLIPRQPGDQTDKKEENTAALATAAQYFLKYVFQYILGWTPYQVRDYLDDDIIERYALRNCIKNVPFPQELNSMRDYYFIASWLYPETIPYDKEKAILNVYTRVLRHERRYHPNFFKGGPAGEEIFLTCLRYALSVDFFSRGVQDIYQFFTKPSNTNAFASKWGLKAHYNKWYDNFMDAVHNALPAVDRNDFLRHFANFSVEYKKKYGESEDLLCD